MLLWCWCGECGRKRVVVVGSLADAGLGFWCKDCHRTTKNRSRSEVRMELGWVPASVVEAWTSGEAVADEASKVVKRS